MSSTRESLCMCDLCRKRAAAYARTEAFAAVRRAAAVARRAEKWSGVSAYEGFVMAQGVRAAIRAAIGSEKQS
jgi:hypothetical protein